MAPAGQADSRWRAPRPFVVNQSKTPAPNGPASHLVASTHQTNHFGLPKSNIWLAATSTGRPWCIAGSNRQSRTAVTASCAR